MKRFRQLIFSRTYTTSGEKRELDSTLRASLLGGTSSKVGEPDEFFATDIVELETHDAVDDEPDRVIVELEDLREIVRRADAQLKLKEDT